jgi:hypothetical protein
MEYITNWKFWLAVIVVATVTHFAINFLMPKAG